MPFIQLFDCFLNTFFAGPRKPAFAELALNQGSFSIRMAGDASDEIYRLLQLALQNQENGMVMHLQGAFERLPDLAETIHLVFNFQPVIFNH